MCACGKHEPQRTNSDVYVACMSQMPRALSPSLSLALARSIVLSACGPTFFDTWGRLVALFPGSALGFYLEVVATKPVDPGLGSGFRVQG